MSFDEDWVRIEGIVADGAMEGKGKCGPRGVTLDFPTFLPVDSPCDHDDVGRMDIYIHGDWDEISSAIGIS